MGSTLRYRSAVIEQTTEAAWAEAAAPFGVDPTIHPDDLLWDFLLTLPQMSTPALAAEHYFSDGATSARQLADLLSRHLPDRVAEGNLRLLEFASGYGMVSRHLPAALTGVSITSCDIHPAAVEFISEQLDGTAVLSEHEPEDLRLAEPFDAVFALSFFSHMPATSFGRWLGALYAAVRPGGILAFTTHGSVSHTIFGSPELDDAGYWFQPNSEQSDLVGAEYGSTVSLVPFVVRELYQHSQAPLAEYRNGYWWNHQDLYVARKPR
jgi:SAM-dependent methyltransferase